MSCHHAKGKDTRYEPLLPELGTLQNVLIVGAGVAGLQTARFLKALGCNVVLLESKDNIGGVWTQGYWGYGLQVPWRAYQFPEFPWPPELQPATEYPAADAVQRYVEAYADAFDLRRHVRLGCMLQRLRWDAAARRWEALYWDMHADKQCKLQADFVVMCTGCFSRPHVPAIPGSELFSGLQLPAREFTDVESARGRRVLVIGAGKSALDVVCGLVASRAAESVSLLYRKAHWPLPRKLLGVPVRKLLFNRAASVVLPPYYTAGPASSVAGAVTAPLRKLFWKAVEWSVAGTFKTTGRIRPHVPLPQDLFYGTQVLGDRLDQLMGDPGVTTIRGYVKRFVEDGAILQDGTFLPADVVLYCTGYGKTYDYLDPDMQSRLGVQKDGLYLYRHVLPHAVPHLAFVGSEVSTFSGILTPGLQALWLARVLSGCVRLPPPPAMAADVRRQEAWRRRVMPLQRNRAGVLQLYMNHYHDQLVEDMGAHRLRKLAACRPLAECFGAYTGEEYTELMRAPLPTKANARLAAARAAGHAAAASAAAPPAEARAAEAAAAMMMAAAASQDGPSEGRVSNASNAEAEAAATAVARVSDEAGPAAKAGNRAAAAAGSLPGMRSDETAASAAASVWDVELSLSLPQLASLPPPPTAPAQGRKRQQEPRQPQSAGATVPGVGACSAAAAAAAGARSPGAGDGGSGAFTLRGRSPAEYSS